MQSSRPAAPAETIGTSAAGGVGRGRAEGAGAASGACDWSREDRCGCRGFFLQDFHESLPILLVAAELHMHKVTRLTDASKTGIRMMAATHERRLVVSANIPICVGADRDALLRRNVLVPVAEEGSRAKLVSKTLP